MSSRTAQNVEQSPRVEGSFLDFRPTIRENEEKPPSNDGKTGQVNESFGKVIILSHLFAQLAFDSGMLRLLTRESLNAVGWRAVDLKWPVSLFLNRCPKTS